LDDVQLAEIVIDAAHAGRQFAGYHTLRRYERARKTGNSTMLLAMDFFKVFSAHPNRFVQTLWHSGMHSVNQLSFIKQYLMGFALGTRGELPRLAACAET